MGQADPVTTAQRVHPIGVRVLARPGISRPGRRWWTLAGMAAVVVVVVVRGVRWTTA